MNVTDADRALVDAICNARSSPERDEAAARHREQARREALEEAVRLIESGMFNSRGQAQPALVAKLRALIGETT